ncbi:3672_t:CDS:1, partial [Cetraspora pellucida]
DKAIPIFEAKFPNATAMFAFDNSTNHGAYAEDALIAARMNLKPGGNQPIMQSTTFVEANGQLNTQHIVFEKDYVFKKDEDYDETMRGKPKGIKV